MSALAANLAVGVLAGVQQFLDDKYAVYVLSAYISTAVILGWMVWSTIAANARARKALQELEKDRSR